MTTDESPRQRTGGRAGRTAARLRTHVERVPFLTRTLKPVRGPRGGEPHRRSRRTPTRSSSEVGLEFRGDPERAPAVPQRRRRRRRRAGPLPPRDVPPDRPGHRPAPVHPVRAQPRQQRPDRRDAHGPRPELRLAVRPRPRQRPALRHDRGLPQLREARLHEPAPPPQRRDGLRAGRRAGQQAPPRHGLFAHPLQRQAVHGLRHRAGAGPRHRRDGAAHVRGRLSRGPRGDPLAHQRELAARLGRDDARGGAGLRRGQPGDAPDAVHPGRGDGAGDGCRGLRPDPRRGARWDGLRPTRSARRAGRARQLRQLDVDAVGGADVRDAGARPRALRDGGARPPARRSVPLRRQPLRVEDRGRPGRVRVRCDLRANDPRRRQLRPPRRRLARGRPRRRLREVHPRRRPVRDGRGLRQGHRHVARTARRSTRSSTTGRASTSSARPTRWPTSRRPSTDPRPPTTTASSNGRRTAGSTRPSGRTGSGSGCSASTRRRRSTRASTRRSRSSSPSARRPSRTRKSRPAACSFGADRRWPRPPARRWPASCGRRPSSSCR